MGSKNTSKKVTKKKVTRKKKVVKKLTREQRRAAYARGEF